MKHTDFLTVPYVKNTTEKIPCLGEANIRMAPHVFFDVNMCIVLPTCQKNHILG